MNELLKDEQPTQFINFYECYECNHKWIDVWDCMVDDRCPSCGFKHNSPYKSEEVEHDTA